MAMSKAEKLAARDAATGARGRKGSVHGTRGVTADGQICWSCKRACGGCGSDGEECPWSRFGEPVEGWEAEPTVIVNDTGIVKSFQIKKCPMYDQEVDYYLDAGLVPLLCKKLGFGRHSLNGKADFAVAVYEEYYLPWRFERVKREAELGVLTQAEADAKYKALYTKLRKKYIHDKRVAAYAARKAEREAEARRED